ncbi:MAG TPA: cell division protein SepF [Geodermatophilus sp.]|nr:cell division protein SepF [Geodermatophilus sp.]
MAGAMRKMGIYLGLVEDDDARAYSRYDGRQSDYPDRHDDRRYGRYTEDSYDGRYAEADYRDSDYRDPDYRDGEYEDELAAEPAPAPDPEPVVLRRSGSSRNLGVASAAPAASPSPRLSGLAGGSTTAGAGAAGAPGLAVREPVAAAPEPAPAPAPQPYRITTLHPKTYNEARQIGESFRDGMPVIMNLSEMDDADAKRLVDFAAGLSFGLRGSIERVTAKVFLLSPRDVDVTAEDKARIREGGFFNQS